MATPTPHNNDQRSVIRRFGLEMLMVAGILAVLAMFMVPAIHVGPVGSPQTRYLHDVRQVGILMMQYALDNGNQYPTGTTSTEVFQELIDTGYLEAEAAASMLYIEGMPGKVPYPGTGPLQPENVCYDVAAPATLSSHDGLPLIVSTGWELTFEAQAPATERDRTLTRTPILMRDGHPVMILFRKGGSAEILQKPDQEPVIPISYRDATTYRQLRP